VLVAVALQLVCRRQACFVHHQQVLILADSMQHAPLKMVLLSIPKVVRAERVIALLPMVCFVRRHSMLALSIHHAPLKMVLLSIPNIVLAVRVTALLPMVYSVWLH